MLSVLANLLTGAAGLVVDVKCPILWVDEPTCPKSLIK